MMVLAAHNLVEWLAGRTNLPKGSVEQIVWVVLLGGLVFASVHLITMLITRWGDQASTSKSLIFSVLVHLSCAFGLVVVAPPEPLAETPSQEEDRIDIVQLVVEGEQDTQLDAAGNTATWEHPSLRPEQDLSRLARARLELRHAEGSQRDEQSITPPDLVYPDLPSWPDDPVNVPSPDRSSQADMQVEAAVPFKLDDPIAEANPETVVLSIPSRIRTFKMSAGMQLRPVERTPRRGSIDRVQDELEPDRKLSSIDAANDPSSLLRRGPQDDSIHRRVGPAPTKLPSEELGKNKENDSKGMESGASAPPRFARIPTRNPRSHEKGGVQRIRPERTPKTRDPSDAATSVVRQGIPNSVASNELKLNVARPNFEPLRDRKKPSIPATYQLRSLARRREVAQRYGGTDASERAVETSLRWLILHQHPQGHWDGDGFSTHCPEGDRCSGHAGRLLHGTDKRSDDERRAGLHADAGLTALSVLAFLGAGYTHEEGQYANQVNRALDWLIRQQQDDGYLGGNATHYARMYCHGMATYVLAEALGMQSDPTVDTGLREPLQRAVAYIVTHQNSEDGGWRYIQGQSSDMSIFGWQLMALKSAEIAGIPMPSETRSKMIQFLIDRSLGERKGLATYRITVEPSPATPSMTAEALFCKQILGINRSNPASRQAVEYLQGHLPKRSQYNLYYWYYGTLAMYQYGGKPWRQWNESLRDTLVQDQRQSGHAAGSWDPRPPWGPSGGRIYSTALGTLCLEVYYRFLPLYQMGNR